jgi:hypothetical protein
MGFGLEKLRVLVLTRSRDVVSFGHRFNPCATHEIQDWLTLIVPPFSRKNNGSEELLQKIYRFLGNKYYARSLFPLGTVHGTLADMG